MPSRTDQRAAETTTTPDRGTETENEDLHRWADTPLPADIIRRGNVRHSPEVQLTVSGCPRVRRVGWIRQRRALTVI